MPNKRKRCSREGYKNRYKSYRVNEIREKHKALNMVRDALRSGTPKATLNKLVKFNRDANILSFIDKYRVRYGI